MFNLAIDAITIEDIEKFLQAGARENTVFELKEQFPGRLEKFIASMANTYGGMILIGVEETSTGGGVVPIKGLSLASGYRERVNEIGLNAIYPPLIPEVRVVEFKSDSSLPAPDKAVVVIRVHESEEGHAVDQRTTIYVRADNVSDRIRKATIEETEWFFQKRQRSIEVKNSMLRQAQQHAEQFLSRLRYRTQRSTSEPAGRFVIWTVPTFPRLPIAAPKDIYAVTRRHIRAGPHLGQFPCGSPRPLFEGVYYAHDETRNYFYTEILQQGLIYNEFEFWWDGAFAEPVFSSEAAAILLRLTGEFANAVYRDLGYFGLYDIGIRLSGVRDRSIQPTDWFKPKMLDEVVEFNARMRVASSNTELLPVFKELLRQIYWSFGWDVDDKRIENDFKS